MDFLQRTPFFRLLVPFACGIVAFKQVELSDFTRVIILLIAVSLIFISFLVRQSRHAYSLRWLFGAGVLMFNFILGYFISEREQERTAFAPINKQAVFMASLLESPVEKLASMACKVRVEGYAEHNQFIKIASPALIYIAKDSASMCLKKGDVLIFRTTFQRPTGAMNPAGFDYAAYFADKGIRATAYIPAQEWKQIRHHTKFSLSDPAEQCRKNLLNLYRTLELPEDQFAVLAALTIGYKDAISSELREEFGHSGAMHILAVSGLHVGLIYFILQTLFSLLFKKSSNKLIPVFFTICALWMYAFITGLPPSVIRATTMFSLVAIAVSIGRKSQIYNTIFVSAFIILLYDPYLLFDTGFQLSYSAVIGIIYFQPKISSLLYVKNKWVKWWWNLTAVSLAAQIATLPLVLYYFHQFPNYFLLTNYIAIPLASMIIYLTIVFLLFSGIPVLADLPVFILKKLLFVLNFSVEMIHDLPYAISTCYLNLFQLFLLFAVLFFFSLFIENKKYRSLMCCLLLLLIFILSHTFIHYQSSQTCRLIVYADRKQMHVNLIDRYHHRILTTDSIAACFSGSDYWKSRKLHNPDFEILDSTVLYTFREKSILILTDNLFDRKTTKQPIKTDFLIIHCGVKFRAKELLDCVSPLFCIAGQGVSTGHIDQLKKICREKNISFYSVAEQGAYIYDFKRTSP